MTHQTIIEDPLIEDHSLLDLVSIDPRYIRPGWRFGQRVQLADGRKGWFLRPCPSPAKGLLNCRVRIDRRTRSN